MQPGTRQRAAFRADPSPYKRRGGGSAWCKLVLSPPPSDIMASDPHANHGFSFSSHSGNSEGSKATCRFMCGANGGPFGARNCGIGRQNSYTECRPTFIQEDHFHGVSLMCGTTCMPSCTPSEVSISKRQLGKKPNKTHYSPQNEKINSFQQTSVRQVMCCLHILST